MATQVLLSNYLNLKWLPIQDVKWEKICILLKKNILKTQTYIVRKCKLQLFIIKMRGNQIFYQINGNMDCMAFVKLCISNFPFCAMFWVLYMNMFSIFCVFYSKMITILKNNNSIESILGSRASWEIWEKYI